MRMQQSNFKPYTEKELPVGFKYPESYLKLSLGLKEINSIPYFSWWFSDANESLEEVTDIYYKLTGRKNLFDFARDGDWAACFDLTDHSGNPKVFVYDLGNKQNFYVKETFDEWLHFIITNI
jgi:hypothetical protein